MVPITAYNEKDMYCIPQLQYGAYLVTFLSKLYSVIFDISKILLNRSQRIETKKEWKIDLDRGQVVAVRM